MDEKLVKALRLENHRLREENANFWEALDCDSNNCAFPTCSINGGPCSKSRLRKENESLTKRIAVFLEKFEQTK